MARSSSGKKGKGDEYRVVADADGNPMGAVPPVAKYPRKKCYQCDKEFQATGPNHIRCRKCAAVAHYESVMVSVDRRRTASRLERLKDRKCAECGTPIPIECHGRVKYCIPCAVIKRDISRKNNDPRYREKGYNPAKDPYNLGKMNCQDCGKEMEKHSGSQVRCSVCAYKRYLKRHRDAARRTHQKKKAAGGGQAKPPK